MVALTVPAHAPIATAASCSGDATVANHAQLAAAVVTANGAAADYVICLSPGTYTATEPMTYTGGNTLTLVGTGASAADTVVVGLAGTTTLRANPGSLAVNSIRFIDAGNTAVWVTNGNLGIVDSVFQDNEGEYGGAVRAGPVPELMNISGSTFERNKSTNGGGAIYINEIEDLTITDSSFLMNEAPGDGGAVLARNLADLTSIEGSSFVGNKGNQGGAIALVSDAGLGGRLYMEKSTLEENRGASFGGAVRADDLAFVFVQQSSFVTNYSGFVGGAIAVDNPPTGSTKIVNAYFDRNEAKVGGGALYIRSDGTGSSTIDYSTFSDNFTPGTYGGAIEVDNSGVLLRRTAIVGNGAKLSGGGLSAPDSHTVIEFSLFEENYTQTLSGGAAEIGGGSIAGTSIIGNQAQGGSGFVGGIQSFGDLSVENSTFSGNSASADDSANALSVEYHDLELLHVTFGRGQNVGNVGAFTADASALHNCGAIVGTRLGDYSYYSASGGCNIPGTDVFAGTDAGLKPLADNLGLTAGAAGQKWTIRTLGLEGDSPLIDRAPVTLSADQRGKLRPVGDKSDAGAFEANPLGVFVAGGTAAVSDSVIDQIEVASERTVERLFGANRYATAAAISQAAFPTKKSGGAYPIIASGENFPDAMGAGPAAVSKESGILLTRKNSLPAETKAELERLSIEEITIVGGTAVISTAVETELGKLGDVVRIAGSNRYDTAVKVSEHFFDSSSKVFIASGTSFPDGLAAGPVAGLFDAPLLLTNGSSLSSGVMDEIARLGATEAIIVGGTAVVGTDVEGQLAGAGVSVARAAGANRYDTSVKVAQLIGIDTDGVLVASGESFPDALTIGPYAGLLGRGVVLTKKTSLPSAPNAHLISVYETII